MTHLLLDLFGASVTAPIVWLAWAMLVAHSSSFDESYYYSTFASMTKKLVKWKKYTFFNMTLLPWFDKFFHIICKFRQNYHCVTSPLIHYHHHQIWSPAGCSIYNMAENCLFVMYSLKIVTYLLSSWLISRFDCIWYCIVQEMERANQKMGRVNLIASFHLLPYNKQLGHYLSKVLITK